VSIRIYSPRRIRERGVRAEFNRDDARTRRFARIFTAEKRGRGVFAERFNREPAYWQAGTQWREESQGNHRHPLYSLITCRCTGITGQGTIGLEIIRIGSIRRSVRVGRCIGRGRLNAVRINHRIGITACCFLGGQPGG